MLTGGDRGVLPLSAYSDWLPVMTSRLHFEPPKVALEMVSGMRITPMRAQDQVSPIALYAPPPASIG
jgi:hypothetical protein